MNAYDKQPREVLVRRGAVRLALKKVCLEKSSVRKSNLSRAAGTTKKHFGYHSPI